MIIKLKNKLILRNQKLLSNKHYNNFYQKMNIRKILNL